MNRIIKIVKVTSKDFTGEYEVQFSVRRDGTIQAQTFLCGIEAPQLPEKVSDFIFRQLSLMELRNA